MPANVYMKSFLLASTSFAPLADVSMVLNATIIASSKNTGTVEVRWKGGTPALWPPGAVVMFEGVDIADFEVRGTAGHQLLVVGYTR